MGTEDLRDLQSGTPHGRALGGMQGLQGTDHLPQEVGGDLGIERRGLEPLAPEQHLDHPDIHLLFQQMGGIAVTQVCIETRLSIPAAAAAA